MKKNLFKIIIAFSLLTMCSAVQSQVTTFDYLNSGLSTAPCNIFDPQVTINGTVHSSYAGGVIFNSSGLFLTTRPLESPPRATAFVINYTFVPGYNYTIAITAKGKPSVYLKTSVVPNFTSFLTNSMTSCVADNNAYLYTTAGYAQASFQTSTTSTTYNVAQFSVPSNYPYLIVWASGGNINLDGLSISKIVITKTAITSFNITPGNVQLPCGSTTPEPFTINNGSGTTGITDYTWNLGSTPNGWKLPNGSAAPATYSTGTTPTLSLTPVCATTPKNISATVTANGNTYNTNTSTISIVPPAITISSNAPLCSGSRNYSVLGLPCNASVSWVISPSGIVTPSVIGNTVTLTKNASATGVITLTANITGNCGPLSTSTQIQVGNITPSIYAVLTSGPGEPTTYNFIATSIPGAIYTWYVTGAVNNPQQTGSFNEFDWYFACNQSRTVYCVVTTNCGNATSNSITKTGGCDRGLIFQLSPNPATNSFTITSQQNTLNSSAVGNPTSFNEIRIYDPLGNLKKYEKTNSVTKNLIDVSNLGNGLYIVEISDGTYREKHQLLIQK
ncbi:hypothetical protein BH20BAC1_BH20BAC1_03770 [soil metagenome]